MLRAFAFLRRLRSFFVRRFSLPLFLSLPNAMLSLAPRLVHVFRVTASLSLLSRIVALSLPPSLSLSPFMHLALAPFIPRAHGRPLPLAERSATSPSVPRLPLLPPLPYLDTVRARSPPATLEWERRVRSSLTVQRVSRFRRRK